MTAPAPTRKLDVGAMTENDASPVPYRIAQLVADGHTTILASHAGEGKSLLGMALAIGVVAGSAVGGLTCTQGRALIFDAENGERMIHRRYRLAAGPADGIAIHEATGMSIARHGDYIERMIEEERANFVLFDSLRSLAPGMQENDGDTVLPVMQTLLGISRKTQAGILVLHHRPKIGAGYRGSTVLRDQADALFVLGRDPDDPLRKTRRSLHCDPGRDGKMRFDAEPDDRWLDIDLTGGLLTVMAATPFKAAIKAEKRDAIGSQIPDLLLGSDGMTGSEIARKLGREPADGTVRRALDRLAHADVLQRGKDKRYRLTLPGGIDGWQGGKEQVAKLPHPFRGWQVATAS